MKTLQIIVLMTAVMALAISAYAQCPDAIGTWSTTNSTMIGGRASEAWCTVPYGGQPGNTQNAMSWDGASLGTQWKAWGMTIDSGGADLITDNVDPGTGNGTQTYQTFYEGGQFWLDGGHTWGDGINDLTGDLTYFEVVATITFVGGQQFGMTSNISFAGEFANCPEFQDCRLTFAISNAIRVWTTNSGNPMPANYPALLCGATGGEAFDVCCITLAIECAVPVEKETWSHIKALYR